MLQVAVGTSGGFLRQGAIDEMAQSRADVDDDDDETAASPAAKPIAASAAATAGSDGPTAAAAARRFATNPRLRTRLFAAACLLDIFEACRGNAAHVDPSKWQPKASAVAGPDTLIAHLQSLIGLGFKLTTGTVEALKPLGAQVLVKVIDFFGQVRWRP